MSEENLYTFENPEYRKTFWHTSSHVMAQAVTWELVCQKVVRSSGFSKVYRFSSDIGFTSF